MNKQVNNLINVLINREFRVHSFSFYLLQWNYRSSFCLLLWKCTSVATFRLCRCRCDILYPRRRYPRCTLCIRCEYTCFCRISHTGMGSSMGKYSYGDDPYYKRRRKTGENPLNYSSHLIFLFATGHICIFLLSRNRRTLLEGILRILAMSFAEKDFGYICYRKK